MEKTDSFLEVDERKIKSEIAKEKEDLRKKLNSIRLDFHNIFLIFVVSSFIGCVLETIYTLIQDGRFEFRVGILYGPFIPIYGFGASLFTVALRNFSGKGNVVIFFVGLSIGTILEYFCSLAQELLFGTVSWDYSGTFMNIHGRTNLAFGVMWGILAIVWIKIIYPFVIHALDKFAPKIKRVTAVSFLIFFVISGIMSGYALIRRDAREMDIPASNMIEVYLDNNYPDEKLDIIFPNMKEV